jgi:hypothetical protein
VDVKSVMGAFHPAENILIKPNDVISVPKADIIYVISAVNKPGASTTRAPQRLGEIFPFLAARYSNGPYVSLWARTSASMNRTSRDPAASRQSARPLRTFPHLPRVVRRPIIYD